MIKRRVAPIGAAGVAALTLLLVPASATAQSPAGVAPAGNQQVISANPFLLMYKWFNVEYERRHKEATTWGASASLLPFDDADYGNVAVFYRYYPQGRALEGFYVGGRTGIHRVSAGGESGAFGGVGFELGYDWLLGNQKNFSIGLGAGATRLFGGDLDGVALTVPTIRLVNIGWSF